MKLQEAADLIKQASVNGYEFSLCIYYFIDDLNMLISQSNDKSQIVATKKTTVESFESDLLAMCDTEAAKSARANEIKRQMTVLEDELKSMED